MEHHFGATETVGNHATRPVRPVWPAIKRGFLGRCPHCGEGRLFRGFLKSVDQCPVCHEEMHHHRADDLPAYLVIAVVGHVVVGAALGVETMTVWPTWVHLALWLPLTLILALALLRPVKGAIIGLQWALYMHGFGGERDELETHPELQQGQ